MEATVCRSAVLQCFWSAGAALPYGSLSVAGSSLSIIFSVISLRLLIKQCPLGSRQIKHPALFLFPCQLLRMPGPPHQLVLREGCQAVLPQGLLAEVWGVLPRLLAADDGACHGKPRPVLSLAVASWYPGLPSGRGELPFFATEMDRRASLPEGPYKHTPSSKQGAVLQGGAGKTGEASVEILSPHGCLQGAFAKSKRTLVSLRKKKKTSLIVTEW